MTFERFIGIDWSGAGTYEARNAGLAVAMVDGALLTTVEPPSYKRWSRQTLEVWVGEQLETEQPTFIGVDAALSFSYGFQREVFGVHTWTDMVHALAELAMDHEFARTMAQTINDQCTDGGPFRFNDSRNDARFYTNRGVAYWRVCEMFTPQCISPYYLGSGANVGFHTLTFLPALSRLIRLRETGAIDFEVWPFEYTGRQTHVIGEAYPALYPSLSDERSHAHDAAKIASWLSLRDPLADFLEIEATGIGVSGVEWSDVLRFEGWILGV